MRRNIFLNPELEKQFDKDGYVIIDLLTDTDRTELFALMDSLRDEGKDVELNTDSEYKLSFFASSPEYRQRILKEVGSFFQAKVDAYLDKYKPLIINLFDKEPGGGEVPVHQNWTFVDESKYTSVSVWIPLCDVTRENGTMEIVKGSHRVLTDYRSPSIPWVFNDIFDQIKEKYMEPLNLKIGQAAIIDDGILHYTSINETENVRSTIQLIMHPEEAMPLHYYRDPANPDQLEVFEVDSSFFTRFNMQEKPAGVKSTGMIPFKYKNLTETELVETVSQNNPGIRQMAGV